MKAPVITLANDFHHDTSVVRVSFEKDYSLIGKVKMLKGAAWRQSRGFWYIAKSDFKLNNVFETLKDVAWVDYSALKSNTPNALPKTKKQKPYPKQQITLPEAYTNLLDQKHYAENTKAIANTALAKIKSPLDHFFEDNVNDINTLQK